jgi:rieske iron-sulfur protein
VGLFEECHARRAWLKAGIGLGIQLGLVPIARSQTNPASVRPQEGDLLIRVGDTNAVPLTPSDIPLGAKQTMAWAMDPDGKTVRSASRLNRIVLVRLDPEKLGAETKARAVDGVVAYTAICTHTGCEVTEWIPDDRLLDCPCHSSKFDPADGAKVMDGPAPRPLPALPLKLVDGKLAVAKPFTARIAFEPA